MFYNCNSRSKQRSMPLQWFDLMPLQMFYNCNSRSNNDQCPYNVSILCHNKCFIIVFQDQTMINALIMFCSYAITNIDPGSNQLPKGIVSRDLWITLISRTKFTAQRGVRLRIASEFHVNNSAKPKSYAKIF